MLVNTTGRAVSGALTGGVGLQRDTVTAMTTLGRAGGVPGGASLACPSWDERSQLEGDGCGRV
jgi:hypothetical protein